MNQHRDSESLSPIGLAAQTSTALRPETITPTTIAPISEVSHRAVRLVEAGFAPSIRAFAFHGETSELFSIFARTLLLSALTLGIYSFWGRVRMRRYLHSNLELDGDAFAYHGNAGQLLRGAVLFGVCVAVMIGASFVAWGPERLPDNRYRFDLTLYSMIALTMPWFLASSWRFRAAMVSWRGVRFSFRGSVWGAYKTWLGWGALTLLSFGIAMPLLRARMRRCLVGQTYFGSLPLVSDDTGKDLVGSHLFGALFKLPSLGFAWQAFLAAERRSFFRSVSIQEAFLVSNADARGFWKINVAMNFVVMLTLGLAWPWREIAKWRYLAETTQLVGQENLDASIQELQGGAWRTVESDGMDAGADCGLAI